MEIPPEVAGLGVKLATGQTNEGRFWADDNLYQMAILRMIFDEFLYLFVGKQRLMENVRFFQRPHEWRLGIDNVWRSLGDPMKGGTDRYEWVVEIGGNFFDL